MRQYGFKRLQSLSFLLTILLILLWKALPYSSPIRLSVRFNFHLLTIALFPPLQPPSWFNPSAPPAYRVVLPDDVAAVIKFGLGTKDRIPIWLQAHQGKNLSDVLLIAHFASHPGQYYIYDDTQLPVHDMIAEMNESGSIPADLVHPRLLKYADLRESILRGDMETAMRLSSVFGCELESQACHLSSWMIPREKAHRKVSGINVSRAKMMYNAC